MCKLIYMYTLENELIKLKICAKVARFIKTKQFQTLKKVPYPSPGANKPLIQRRSNWDVSAQL